MDHAAVIALTALTALVVLVIWACRGLRFRGRAAEPFASKRAQLVTSQARRAFAGGGDASYSVYKSMVAGAEPVQYADIRNLWRGDRLTADNVQAVL